VGEERVELSPRFNRDRFLRPTRLPIPPLAQKNKSKIKYQKLKSFKYYTKNFSLLKAIKDTNDANIKER
jgi:hypothetical protein